MICMLILYVNNIYIEYVAMHWTLLINRKLFRAIMYWRKTQGSFTVACFKLEA